MKFDPIIASPDTGGAYSILAAGSGVTYGDQLSSIRNVFLALSLESRSRCAVKSGTNIYRVLDLNGLFSSVFVATTGHTIISTVDLRDNDFRQSTYAAGSGTDFRLNNLTNSTVATGAGLELITFN